MNDIYRLILDGIYPPRCPVCEKVTRKLGTTCEECKDVFVRIKKPFCMKCGKSLSDNETQYCLDCTKKNMHYVRGFPLWNYDKNTRKSLSAFKYHNKKEYAHYYAKQMVLHRGEDIMGVRPQLLIPVPVHVSRLRQRGYNQAEILANLISNYIKVPVSNDLLIRTKKTLPQKQLNDIERLKNLCQAFEISTKNDIIRSRNIKTVMLVDDIYTTGSTIEACTLALMRAGVENVYFTSVCIGRGYN